MMVEHAALRCQHHTSLPPGPARTGICVCTPHRRIQSHPHWHEPTVTMPEPGWHASDGVRAKLELKLERERRVNTAGVSPHAPDSVATATALRVNFTIRGSSPALGAEMAEWLPQDANQRDVTMRSLCKGTIEHVRCHEGVRGDAGAGLSQRRPESGADGLPDCTRAAAHLTHCDQ